MDITSLIETKRNPNIPVLRPGDTVKVRVRVVEGEKERIQVFQGVVIRLKNGGAGASFTVRRVSFGIGVERTFPFTSPMVEGVEVVRHGKVRRAKLYYLRGRSAKASRIKERRILTEPGQQTLAQAEAVIEETPEVPGEATPEAEVEAAPETKLETEPETEPEEEKTAE